MTPALAIAIALVGLIVLIVLFLWIRYRNWQDMQGLLMNVAIFLAVLLFIDLVWYVTFDLPTLASGAVGYLGIILLGAFLVTLHALTLLRFFYSLRPRGPDPTNREPNRLLGLWNWDKALSGAALADLANSVGVLAGIGGHIILSQAAGWWWIGQLGTLLALIVGYSFWQRWLVEGQSETPEAGMLNTTVGVFTLLALMAPVSLNPAFLHGWHATEWFWIIFLGLLTAIIPTALILTRFNQHHTVHLDWPRVLSSLLLLIWVGGAFTAMLLFQWYTPPEALVFWFGLIAAFAWLLAELISLGRLAKAWYDRGDINVVNYMTFEKNLWQVTGALVIIVYLITKQVGDVSAFGWTLVFAIGASFAGFGTLRGVVTSLVNRRQKRAQALRVVPRTRALAAIYGDSAL